LVALWTVFFYFYNTLPFTLLPRRTLFEVDFAWDKAHPFGVTLRYGRVTQYVRVPDSTRKSAANLMFRHNEVYPKLWRSGFMVSISEVRITSAYLDAIGIFGRHVAKGLLDLARYGNQFSNAFVPSLN
jgi:hypothetical protein